MKNAARPLALLLLALSLAGGLYGLGEKTLSLGGGAGWDGVSAWSGVTELAQARPYPVLALSSAGSLPGAADLWLSFDEGGGTSFYDHAGHWRVTTVAALESAGQPLARSGAGAARFSGSGSDKRGESGLVAQPGASSLFAPGSRPGDFSLEFWLYPLNVETGATILLWSASVSAGGAGPSGEVVQRIQCETGRNRLLWTFQNFFADPAGDAWVSLSLAGPVLVPKTWSHHLVRFDAALGLLEYLVNGELEAVEYATSTGREGGEVFTPLVGGSGALELGGRFAGLLDEVTIRGAYDEEPVLKKYSREGRVETRTLDLGRPGTRVVRIDLYGGESRGSNGEPRNQYTGSGDLSFPDYAEARIFARSSEAPYVWGSWQPVRSGEDLGTALTGRYLQLAVDLYPSGDGEGTPYLEELRVTYATAEPLPAPSQVTAAARDGAVDLSWKPLASGEAGGYLVYYGTASGEYLGAASPLDAGAATSLRVTGLRNGTLYYFVVAAYRPGEAEAGDFSREIAARPLRALE